MPRAKPTTYQRNARTRVNTVRKVEAAKSAGLQQREEQRTSQVAVREAVHTRERLTTESELDAGRRSRARNAAVSGAVTSTATPSSDSNLIMTTLFVMAGLIVTYILVRNPRSTGFLGGLGTTLHTISSNKPLFVATPTPAKAG
jgi:hypothetical protein